MKKNIKDIVVIAVFLVLIFGLTILSLLKKPVTFSDSPAAQSVPLLYPPQDQKAISHSVTSSNRYVHFVPIRYSAGVRGTTRSQNCLTKFTIKSNAFLDNDPVLCYHENRNFQTGDYIQ